MRFYFSLIIDFGKLGLRYDDLFDPMYDLDVKEALNRLPREIVDARNQRLKRAMDLSMKHEYLPKDLQVFIYCSILRFELFDFCRGPDKLDEFICYACALRILFEGFWNLEIISSCY